MHADFLRFQDFDERAKAGCFPRARAAGEDAELVRESVVQRGALEAVKFEAGFLLRPSQRGIDLDGGQTRRHRCEAGDDFGDLALRAVVVGELNQRASRVELRVEC